MISFNDHSDIRRAFDMLIGAGPGYQVRWPANERGTDDYQLGAGCTDEQVLLIDQSANATECQIPVELLREVALAATICLPTGDRLRQADVMEHA